MSAVLEKLVCGLPTAHLVFADSKYLAIWEHTSQQCLLPSCYSVYTTRFNLLDSVDACRRV